MQTPLYKRGMYPNIEREKQPPRIERDGSPHPSLSPQGRGLR